MNSDKFIVIVTGISGGGKTVTLRTLEDIGFFCIDNLPPEVASHFVETIKDYKDFIKIAIGIDIRVYSFLNKAEEVFERIKKEFRSEILFLDADDESILRRYKETRRPHPLMCQHENLLDAIKKERVLLYPLKKLSDRVIDTSNFNPHQLRSLIRSIYSENEKHPYVTVMSFGYKKGVPVNADIVFDARFLPNPYFIESLRELSGKDPNVKDYVLNQTETKEFLEHIKSFLSFALPKYKKEGRYYITLAVGCTGGKHRSVVLAEELSDFISSLNFKTNVIHRDL
ncbi:MAG: RNase adapter RapZ [Thermodesulfovibrionaceae bacterium]